MDNPTEELRILILEDVPAEAELEEIELREAGLVFSALRVDTREAFERALAEFKPGIVLADYRLPDFTGVEALDLVRKEDKDTPFILLSGTIGEEIAVQSLRAGATDYVLKQKRERLPSAIQRAVAPLLRRARSS